jgi:hypothetical protein
MRNSMVTRRRVLGLAGAVWTTTLAGCETLTDDESPPTTEPVYDHLEDRSMYVAADVDLEVPPSVPTVDVRGEADLFLLPAEPHVSAATAIDWLDEGLVVALVGDGAQETWIDWQQTEASGDAFGGAGYAESEPPPDLLALVPDRDGVTGHNYTWASGYDDSDVLEGLNEALGRE